MLSKFLLSGLLFTSSLTFMSVAMAGFEDDGDTLKISVRKLKSGSKNGEIFVEGTKCSVSNLTQPSWGALDGLEKGDKLKAVKKDGSFYFAHIQDAGFPTKYNYSTEQWATGFNNPIKRIIFDLKVTPLSEKTTVEFNDNVVPSTTIVSTSKLEQKEEKVENKTPVLSSINLSPVDMVEFDFFKNLVLTGKLLSKGLQMGKLVTNQGTFSVTNISYMLPVLYDSVKFTAYASYGSNGEFVLTQVTNSGYEMKLNPQTNQMEYDYTRPIPGKSVVVKIKKIN